MRREFTCIICPNGCEIEATVENGRLVAAAGAACPRGRDYVQQELTAPRRTIASSVPVRNGELPLASVRLDAPVPKERIMDVMREIRGIRLDAPVYAGTVVIGNVLGLGSNVIITKDVHIAAGHQPK